MNLSRNSIATIPIKKGIDIFQALIEFKEIELTPLQQEAASEAAYVRMVNV